MAGALYAAFGPTNTYYAMAGDVEIVRFLKLLGVTIGRGAQVFSLDAWAASRIDMIEDR